MVKIEVFSEVMGKVELIECDKVEIEECSTDWVNAIKDDKVIAIIPSNRVKIIRIERD